MKRIMSKQQRMKKRRYIKGIFLLFILTILGYCSSYVSAGMNDTTIEKNRMDGIYAAVTLNGINRFFYLNLYTMNGKVSYCIDLGVDITTSIYHSSNDFSISNLNNEQIDYIRSISYFGYLYPGHAEYQFYMAAQELIWEYLNPVDIVWTTEMNINGSKIDVDAYKNEILRLRNEYYKEVSLDWINGGIYQVGEEIILNDSNKVLNEYEIVSSKYSSVSINDNSLVIQVGNNIGEEKIRLRKKQAYDFDGLFYYYDVSQRLISNGNYLDINKELSFSIRGVSLNVKVIDNNLSDNVPLGQATLEGAVYELYRENGELVGTYETDKNGLFQVNDLIYGNYYIKQIKASEGYLANKDITTFEINQDNLEIVLRQQVIRGVIDIRKVFGSNGEYYPEEGIVFQAYDVNGVVCSNLKTDNSGRVSASLPYGVYRIHQLNSTSGYLKVDDFIFEVREANQKRVYFNLVNELILVKVKLIHYEQNSGEKLNLDGFSYRIKEKGKSTYLEYDGQDIFTTDSNGEVLIPILLDYGDYILEQVDTPYGILFDENSIEFSINDQSNLNLIDQSLVLEIPIYKELIMGKVLVYSYEELFYSGLNEYGYERIIRNHDSFIFTANEDIIVNGKIIYSKGDEIRYDINDQEDSFTIDSIYLGSYCLSNIETGEEKCFKVESLDNKIKEVLIELEFLKQLSKGDIIIWNGTELGDNIQDSVFEVIDDKNEVIYTGITNEEGLIKVSDLVEGDYCVRQKKTTSLYKGNDEKVCFSLSNEKRVEFINQVIKEEVVSVPNTLSSSVGIYEVLVLFIMIGIGVLVYQKIFASKL